MLHSLVHPAFIGPGGPEFLLVMLVLIIMFGAKDAPRILRNLNEIISKIRQSAEGFKREVMYGDLNAEPRVHPDVEEEEPLHPTEDLDDENEDGDEDEDDEEDDEKESGAERKQQESDLVDTESSDGAEDAEKA